ncbi:MAG: hypothetical protein KKD63_10625 [Proteobacteria bacterium]|nr:hypothetical protein [Desulfobulbaceae bacterium]MBU4153324.1 hypothetical protein [Pseudomonadota bacterium]
MDEQSISPALSLWRYFRNKGRNAWWVLKTKGFRGVWRNVANELMWLSGRYTIHQANAEAARGVQEGKVPKVPDSAFVNRRKVLPPSPRPTQLRVVPGLAPEMDRTAIGQAIFRIKEELRSSSAIKGRLSHDDQ